MPKKTRDTDWMRYGPYNAKRRFQPYKNIDGGGSSNGERAERAFTALKAYIACKSDEPDESHMRDLINDLMHLADREGLDFAKMLKVAIRSYQEESGNALALNIELEVA